MQQFRSDSLGTKLNWEKTPHGYVAFATLAKLGLPLDYVEVEGTRQEYLGSFTEDSISSIRGMPICLGHPESGTYQNNKSGVAVGHFLQEILITDSGELLAPVTITDKRGVDLVEDCLAKGVSPEISPAYWVDTVRQDGKGRFEQCRGRYDHAALLPPGQGRGGKSIALRLDTLDKGSQKMPDIIDATTPAPTMTAPAATAQIDEIAALKRQVETLTGENTGLKTQLASMSETHLSLDSINAKLSTLAKIGKINLDSIDIKTSPADIQKAHIKTLNPSINLDGKSDEFIAGVFESLVATHPVETAATVAVENQLNSDSASATAAINAARSQLAGTRSDSTATADPIEVAKQKRLEQIANANKVAK